MTDTHMTAGGSGGEDGGCLGFIVVGLFVVVVVCLQQCGT